MKRQQNLVNMLNSQGQQLAQSLKTLAPDKPVTIGQEVGDSVELWQNVAEV